MNEHQPTSPGGPDVRDDDIRSPDDDIRSDHGMDRPRADATDPPAATTGASGLGGLLEEHRWIALVLPFVVYMLTGTIEPEPPGEAPVVAGAAAVGHDTDDGWGFGFVLKSYPIVYTVRIALTIAVIVVVWPGYREFPFRVGLLSVAVGVVGAVIWIGLCKLGLEQRLLAPLGLGSILGLGERAAYDPFTQLGQRPVWLAGFLAVRFLGLVAVVALIEEMFLRGFVMRFIENPDDWANIPIGTAGTAAIVSGTVYGVLSHPAELFAAAVWFSLVTWLMVRTRNIWDCVTAHAVTNLVLGIYVVVSQDWWLW